MRGPDQPGPGNPAPGEREPARAGPADTTLPEQAGKAATVKGWEAPHEDDVALAATQAVVGDSAPPASDQTPVLPTAGIPATQVTSLPARSRARYSIRGEHDRGGLGRVLKADDRDLQRPVAIKELLRVAVEGRERFVREARITARLEHPAIVPVHDVGEWEDGTPFYSMKLVRGRPLDELIEATETVDDRLRLVPNVHAVCEALAYAHHQRIIHRDLKPSNVLVGSFGETVVIDWGLAKDLNDVGDDSMPVSRPVSSAPNLTVAGSIMGTPAYMPPEQANGRGVSERTDVYSLGALLYHVLSGKVPYGDSTSVEEVIARVLEESPEPLSDRTLPPDLVAIVSKAMARESADRYANAGELADELDRYLSGRLVEAHAYTVGQRWRRWVRNNRALAAGFAVAVLLIGGVAGLLFERVVAQGQKASALAKSALLTQSRGLLDTDPTSALAWIREFPFTDTNAQEIAAQAVDLGVAAHVFRELEQPVRALRFSHDGAWLFAVGGDKRLFFHPRDHYARAFHQASDGLAFLPDSENFVTTGPVVRIASLVYPRQHTDLSGQRREAAPLPASATADGNWVAQGLEDGMVHVWDIAARTRREIKASDQAIRVVSTAPGGNRLAVIDASQRLAIVGVAPVPLEVDVVPTGTTLSWTNASDRYLIANTGEAVLVFDGATGAAVGAPVAVRTERVIADPATPTRVLWLEPTTGVVQLDIETGERSVVMAAPSGLTTAFAVSPGGNYLAISEPGARLHLRERNGGSARQFRTREFQTTALAFSPDVAWLASGHGDGTVRVWRVDVAPERQPPAELDQRARWFERHTSAWIDRDGVPLSPIKVRAATDRVSSFEHK